MASTLPLALAGTSILVPKSGTIVGIYGYAVGGDDAVLSTNPSFTNPIFRVTDPVVLTGGVNVSGLKIPIKEGERIYIQGFSGTVYVEVS